MPDYVASECKTDTRIMSLLKPKMKRNTWSQIKRARQHIGEMFNEKGSRNNGQKSQAHLERIARRKIVRIKRAQDMAEAVRGAKELIQSRKETSV